MILENWFKLKRKNPDQVRFDRLTKRLESPIERRFWAHGYGRLSGLGHFTPQVKIGQYRVDFALTNIPGVELLKVVIELDGQEFHSTPAQRNYDTERDRYLLRRGWQVVHFTGSQINRDCEGCVLETAYMVREWGRWLRQPRRTIFSWLTGRI
jgi:very-short-patch-repair endonuclease